MIIIIFTKIRNYHVTTKAFHLFLGSNMFVPNLFPNVLSSIRNWEILRLTSLTIITVSTADIWLENNKPESPAVAINSSSQFSAR